MLLVPSPSSEAIVLLIAQNSSGLGMDALCSVYPTTPRRTLQRRLAALVQAQVLVLQGKGRGARYRAPATVVTTPPLSFVPLVAREPGADYPTEPYVPTSPEGEAIKAYVRQLRHLRAISWIAC